jgi:hypothetical protein
VRHVDDPHHPEDEREPARKKEEERTVGDAVERLCDPEFHSSIYDPKRRQVYRKKVRR